MENDTNKKRPLALLVDDDLGFLDSLEAMVQKLGFDTITAKDGQDGWEKYEQYAPGLVITDIYMPKKNGMVLLSQIKETNFDQVVIVITGYAHYKRMVQSLKAPPDGYLSKPFSMEDLYKSIMVAFGRMEE